MNSSNTLEKLKDKASQLPQVPGSYQFKDNEGRVIYVGKAKNLRSRVGSYFRIKLDSGTKTAALVSKINDIEFIEVGSEFEALILEAELIRKYQPHYNIVLKDDRSYLYIVIRNETVSIAGKDVKVKKVITARKPEIQKTDISFGPFPSSGVATNILRTIRKIIPFRDCSSAKFARYERINSPCLYGHIGVCPAPCLQNRDLVLYNRNISYVKKILSGNVGSLVKDIEKKMKKASKNQDFEEAATARNLLNKFSYLKFAVRGAEEYIDNPYLVEDMNKKALDEISSVLKLPKDPERIECYDISNISGKEAVGSMVVATRGRIDKKEYRRFKVKFKETPDDFGMMYEVLSRRFKRAKSKTAWPNPDLLIVDGGAPQVSAANEVLKELDLDISLAGLAKKYEHLVIKSDEGFTEIPTSKETEGMKLLIRLRDEAHRFAQSYHHLLRSKSLRV